MIDSDDRWIWRFHRDQKGWIHEPKVFIDRGRRLPGDPPLQKERRHLRKAEAKQLWASLKTQGWKRLASPAWGDAIEL
ncbi:DUF1651 domain-containing protein [Synechococcus sp. WH 8109]|uniref:DUF1651 domain-containing protein n=1 Tax=Synechococcus sp. WH 8109 TaxID=166314 RepID=UPI0008FF9F24